jgi:hypothetical protein
VNAVLSALPRKVGHSGKPRGPMLPSYIVIEEVNEGLVARSDAEGLLEANLTPPDELWNCPRYLKDLVRTAPYSDMAGESGSAFVRQEFLSTFVQGSKPAISSLVKPSRQLEIRASTPVGIWKGVIGSIDTAQRVFSAELIPLRGSDVQVSGDISFDQMNEDDLPMVRLGAAFYLEQYARTVRRQVSSDTIVRFRRGNVWTAEQVSKVSELSGKFADAMSDARSSMKIAD